MFKNLKKKITDEGGNIDETKKGFAGTSITITPGHASPVRRGSLTNKGSSPLLDERKNKFLNASLDYAGNMSDNEGYNSSQNNCDTSALSDSSDTFMNNEILSEIEAALDDNNDSSSTQVRKLQMEVDMLKTQLCRKNSKLSLLEVRENEKERRIDGYLQQIQMLHIERDKLQSEFKLKTDEVEQLLQETSTLEKRIASLHSELLQLRELKKSDEMHKKNIESLQKELESSTKDKDYLQEQNMQTLLQLDMSKQSLETEKSSLEHKCRMQESQIADLQMQVVSLTNQLNQTDNKLKDMEESYADKKRKSVVESSQQISDLESQLVEKNRIVKAQQQKLADLQKTLRRELKVQTLPNDEEIITRSVPPLNRASSPQPVQSTHPADRLSSANLLPIDNFFGKNKLNHSLDDLHKHTCDHLEKDINFQYLKHVVLKFMLSKESEAVHLIKAVSVLLKFTRDEQRLIKDTLEWKMSWFGSKPQVGMGQKSKIVPSAY